MNDSAPVAHYCASCDVEGSAPLCWLCHKPAEPITRPTYWQISAAQYRDGRPVNTDLPLSL